MADWSLFRGNSQQTGCSSDIGPEEGKIAWRTALGRQWYSPPLIEDGRLYQVCPGRNREKVICLNSSTGEVLWEAVSSQTPGDGRIPARTRLTSRLVSVGKDVLVRATNSDRIYKIAKQDGRLVDEIAENGNLNYRVHPQPLLSGNEKVLFFPLGEEPSGALKTPQPKGRPWNWLVCKDTASGEKKWTFRTGQFFTPVVAKDGAAYLGTLDGYFYCLNIADPEEISDHPIFDATWEQTSPQRIRWSFKIDAPVNAPPLLVDDRLYFGANDGTVYCLDAANGSLLWSFHAGLTHQRSFIHFSKPVFHDGLLYIGSADCEMICLDAGSGKLVWRESMPDWVRACPVIDQERLVVASLDGTITCLVLDSGIPQTLWSKRLNSWQLTCDLVLEEGRVYAVTSDMTLWCLALETGALLWKKTLVEYPDDWVTFDEYQSSPMVSGERIFVGTPARCVTALERRTGRLLWRFETGGEVPCDPICVEGRVYFGNEGGEGEYYCLNAEDGSLIWKQRLGWVWAAANFMEGSLFVPGVDGNAYCLDADTGQIQWSFAAESDLYMAPAIQDDRVYFGSWDHWFYALERKTGDLIWKFHARTYLDSGAPAVAGKRIFLPTMGPHFYCLDATRGDVMWHFAPPNIWSTNTSPAVCGERVVMMAFHYRGHQGHPYEIWTYCLDVDSGRLIWKYPAGGLNGAVVAGNRVFFGSTERGKPYYYCLDLEGSGDGTTTCLWKIPLDFTVLESCTAIVGNTAYILAEDGYLYAIQ